LDISLPIEKASGVHGQARESFRNHNDVRAFVFTVALLVERALRGMVDMRIFLGIILGVVLTIGAAYLYDASTSEPSKAVVQTSIERRPMVNWDVVNANWRGLSLGVRNTWNKLATR
jgi:hypothetical protein